MNSTQRLCVGAALFAAVSSPVLTLNTAALADVGRVAIISSEETGPFRGKMYRVIVGMLQGTAPGGAYSVPIELAFPVASGDFKGFALIDIANMITIGGDPQTWPQQGRPYPFHANFGDDYLFGNGNIYVAVYWDKGGLETLGAGTIAAVGDAYEIFRDAAALARDPSIAGLPLPLAPARGADHVIAAGYSASGDALRSWLHFGLNQAEGAPVFDGVILGVAFDPICTNLDTGEEADCDPAQTDGAKVISLWSESDVQFTGPAFRGETADYRHIEVAGISHVPPANIDFRPYGLLDQNPIDARPVFRAALNNLQLWLDEGTAPPPSIYLDIQHEPTVLADGTLVWDPVRDEDGNTRGGLRLPHMPGERQGMGAPLGEYNGVNPTAEIGPPFAGRFSPFLTDEIQTRYPSREAYVAAVAAAAQALVGSRYILQEDADAYIAEAQGARFWN